MKKTMWTLAACATTVVATLACSSGGGSGGATSCAQSAASPGGASSACSSCVEANCGSQISGFESGCSDYLSCMCPGGAFNASLAQQCQSKAQESSCTSAGQGVATCASQQCASACNGGSGSGSSSGGGSGGSGSSSSGGNQLVGCTFGGFVCDVGIPAADCTGTSGTVVPSCPTANLVGCCKKTASETCYYAGVTSMQQSCMQSGGTWSTTP